MTRHLRVVTPPIAGYPDSYTVRRPGGEQAEAIVSGGGGSWLVMYGFDAEATEPHLQWAASATLPLLFDLATVADYAVELADAYALGVPHWHQLLAAAIRAGDPAYSIAKLHAPRQVILDNGRLHPMCTGDGDIGSSYWLSCPTVRLITDRLGVWLPLTFG